MPVHDDPEIARIRGRQERLRRQKRAAVLISSAIFSVLAWVFFGTIDVVKALFAVGLVIGASITTATLINEYIE
jgi:hypothetical protein